MTFPRAVAGFGAVAALLAVVALAPLPAAAGPTVLTTSLVCADVTLALPPTITQRDAGGTAILKLTSVGDTSLLLTVKASGLPPNTPAACAVLCVVDGVHDLFEYELFKPCGTTNKNGVLSFNGTAPFAPGTFDGGCLLPVPAVWVRPVVVPVLNGVAPVPDPLVVCAPGFGTFLSFPEPPCFDVSCS